MSWARFDHLASLAHDELAPFRGYHRVSAGAREGKRTPDLLITSERLRPAVFSIQLVNPPMPEFREERIRKGRMRLLPRHGRGD